MKHLKLKIYRHTFTDQATIGSLYIDDKFFCYTLEDGDFFLKNTDSLEHILKIKISGKTAIPYGIYTVVWAYSNSLKRFTARMLNVKGFTGCLFHSGNKADDSRGCILLGYKFSYELISDSRHAVRDFEKIICKAAEEKKAITVEIVKENTTLTVK